MGTGLGRWQQKKGAVHWKAVQAFHVMNWTLCPFAYGSCLCRGIKVMEVGGNGHIWGCPLKPSWAFCSLCLFTLLVDLLRGLPYGYHSYFGLLVMLPIPLSIYLWKTFLQNAVYSKNIKFCHRGKFHQASTDMQVLISHCPESSRAPTVCAQQVLMYGFMTGLIES